MTPGDTRRGVRQTPSRPAAFGRHSGIILATLHCGLAMFVFGTAWAKMTEPFDLLSLLMIWPADTTPAVVRTVGWIELMLAAAVAAPLLREWRGRIAAVAATVTLSANAVVMTAWYILHRDPGLVTTNLVLILIGGAILVGHRPRPPGAACDPGCGPRKASGPIGAGIPPATGTLRIGQDPGCRASAPLNPPPQGPGASAVPVTERSDLRLQDPFRWPGDRPCRGGSAIGSEHGDCHRPIDANPFL
ncbi:hypothetical protein [Brevundimonas sp. R86498]|uniref:hypothetical protein n=1 Tax=Brevundimonas sp. R86498 TaxID=3093845 RepID=UPI0037C7B18F